MDNNQPIQRDFRSLSSEELERIAKDFKGEYTPATREAAARELMPRLTFTADLKHFGHFVMPNLCGTCGAQPVAGSTTVSVSKLGQETSDTVSITVPLCAKCAEPIRLVERSNDNPLATFIGCFSGIAVVAMLLALFLAAFDRASGVWVAIFGIPALGGVLVLKAMEYATVRALPIDQQRAYSRSKKPVQMLHMGYEVQMTFMNASFAAQFRHLNARRLDR